MVGKLLNREIQPECRFGTVDMPVREEEQFVRRQSFVVMFLFFAAVTVSFADTIVGNFNIDSSLNPVASQGQVTFTLNGDGTIAASLVTYSNDIRGFGFNSTPGDLPESAFSPTTPDNALGWGDAFGSNPSGFACSTCGLAESWTIDGNYASVFDVLNGGGGQSSVDFFLLDSTGNEYGAQAQLASVPEPSAWLLLSTLVAVCFIGTKARRRAQANLR